MKKVNNLQIKHSIFFKISLMVVAAVFITVAAVAFFGALLIQFHFPHDMPVGIEYYVNDLIKGFGLPPDPAKMREAAEGQGLKISYKGPSFSWSYQFPETPVPFRFSPPDDDSLSYAFSRGVFYAKKKVDGHVFIIAFALFDRAPAGIPYVIVLIVILVAVFSVLYFRIRRQLNPIHHLLNGVNRIMQGDFSYQVPVTQADELGKLSDSFNAMTRLIKDMILSKDQLLLDVSHELRSPLTRIKVALEFVEDRKTRQSITDDVNEMEHMILELLETERMKSEFAKDNFETTDIVPLLKETVDGHSGSQPEISLDPPGHSIPLNLDRIRIQMLFRNILNNAIRYSPLDGPPIRIFTGESAETVTITIQDSGRGIPEKDLPYIFEPFYRTDFSRSKETGGYGLGLYICKKIMEHHHGEISVRNADGGGTAVVLTFRK